MNRVETPEQKAKWEHVRVDSGKMADDTEETQSKTSNSDDAHPTNE